MVTTIPFLVNGIEATDYGIRDGSICMVENSKNSAYGSGRVYRLYKAN